MCMASIALPHFYLSLQFEHFSKEPASNLPKHFNTYSMTKIIHSVCPRECAVHGRVLSKYQEQF